MIIKKITIENYLCYCGNKTFELTDGLNIILGENGEGKTKFFEAVEWLFEGTNSGLEMLVSAKKLDETAVGDSFRVKVSITVDQYGETCIISKSFVAKKEEPNECSISNFSIEGIEENSSGERTQVEGTELLDRIFPHQIRKYSMFKGEAELNVFDSDSALANLINLFSEAKHYDKYSEKGEFLKEKAEKAVEDSSKKDKKNEALYHGLQRDIFLLKNDQSKYQVYLNSTEDEIKVIKENLQIAESHVSNASELDTINKRIKSVEDKIANLNGRIDENYTTALFDESWILVNFESLHNEFSKKISVHSKKRRELQSEYDRQQGVKEGEKKARAELLNNAIPLPIGVPSKSHMEEMLAEQICKVCNREAKKGSEAYNFMTTRLKSYLDSLALEENVSEKIKPLYKFDYSNRLENLSMSHEDDLKNLRLVRSNIKELFAFNRDRKKEIEELTDQLAAEKSEREKILGKSSIAEERLDSVLKNYNAWQTDLTNQNRYHLDYSSKLRNVEKDLKVKIEEKEKIDMTSANSFLISTQNILRDIERIFRETKEKKFEEFILKLQSKSNHIFSKINIDAFTGSINFSSRTVSNRVIVDVELQEDGRTFYKPNQSLLTSMHISILFAISQLASETKLENFPMIFDAPTSSFGENKTSQFLNLIADTEGQKILLIKDFLVSDKETKTLTIKKEFENVRRAKAFWVKLERPFDPYNLKTINSQVISL